MSGVWYRVSGKNREVKVVGNLFFCFPAVSVLILLKADFWMLLPETCYLKPVMGGKC